MANNEYLDVYREFFQYFDETLDPNDQLPVKLASYRLFKKEVVGAIFNWTNQYLSDKKCPWHLISFISRIVIEKTRKRCKKQPVQCGFSPSDNVYEPLKLMHTVIEVINEVCFRFKSSLNVQNRQNMAVSYTLPAPEDVYCVVSTSSLKNSRRKMEDRSIVIHDLNTIFTKQDSTPSHYYAVFDGHDGEHAAVYSANHLHQYLAESTNFISNPEEAIKDAFCKTDSMFIKKCETDNISGGTTAVCSLLLPKEKTLYVAWVGDSQAVLVSEGKVLPCVVPHKPDREDERRRIESDGGMVLYWGVWRVNGQLGVSRAIGDPEYKPYVTAIPEIIKIPLVGEEDFLVLGSDGLWDHVSNKEIADVVYNAVRTNPEKAQTVSRELVQLAKNYGSGDNTSVIVVFLRDPHKIAAAPKWNTRLVSMDTLDNANNPFAIPNKTNIDRITTETDDGLLLDFEEELKKNDDLPNNDLMKMLEKSNCGRLTPDFDKEDNLGPETNVDNPDDEPKSPNFDTTKRQSEALNNNQNCNPFNDIEKSVELNLNLKAGTFEGLTSPTEEECDPSANSVHNVSQLIDAGAESESEDEEWNYVRGEEASKESSKPLQISSQVTEEEAEDIEDTMSQLNPNAAEFIPSPARAVSSPLSRLLDEDQVISRSPKKPPTNEVDINVPNQYEFDKDISLKPHEIEEDISNGHQDDLKNETNAINALNSRLDEFHFGPNAAPFTPVKLLDQSETSSTRANFGDEPELMLDTSFNDSILNEDQNDFVQKDDPMSMSFHQDRSDDSNLFDLNKVHMLPEDVDEFIAKEDKTNSLFDDTISDLTEHYPLGRPEEEPTVVGNEFITDLDQEDKKDDHLQVSKSSVPTDERSHSPLENQSKFEEGPILSLNEEVKTPQEEASYASSIEECKIPNTEHAPIQDNDQIILELPSEQNRLNYPFDDESLSISSDRKSPHEDKELYSTKEEKDLCSPVEEKDVCCFIPRNNESKDNQEVYKEKDLINDVDVDCEDNYLIEKHDSVEEKEIIEEKDTVTEKGSGLEERKICSPDEAIASPDSARDIMSPVETEQSYAPPEENIDLISERNETIPKDSAPENGKDGAFFQLENLSAEVVESNISPLHSEEVNSQKAVEDITALIQDQVKDLSIQESPVEENEIITSYREECSLVRETVESPSLEQEISTAELDEDNLEAIEPSRSITELVNESIDITTNCDILESPKQELDTIEIQSTTPKDEKLIELENEKSDAEMAKESVTPTELENSSTVLPQEEESKLIEESTEFLKSDLLCDVSTNSEVPNNKTQENQFEKDSSFTSVEETSSLLKNEEPILQLLSPIREQQQLELSKVTSTPVMSSTEIGKSAEIQVAHEIGTSKTKEADKKPIIKAKSPSTVAKKTPPTSKPTSAASKSALTTTNKPTTKPSTKPIAKTTRTTTTTSRVNLPSKTEPIASKTTSKTLTSTTAKTSTAANRVPLTSRSALSTTSKSNGTTKPAPTKSTSTGAIKKSTDASSTRSNTSTTQIKTTGSTAKTMNTSARSTNVAAPKPRSNTLKTTTSKTVEAPKATTKAPTAPRVPLSSRTATTKTSSLLNNKDVKDSTGKNLSKPRSVTDKQVKETANKLTASSKVVSKTTGINQSVAKSTTATKKTEVTGTKTTSRTITATSKAPIKKPPSEVVKAATTKVNKPKQNGVASVIDQKIIVNEVPKELNTLNGDDQFIKDNSPVDNKLITDELSKSAAN